MNASKRTQGRGQAAGKGLQGSATKAKKARANRSNTAASPSTAKSGPLSHIRWIREVWREKQGLIWLLLFLTLLSSAVAVAFPLLTKQLFDLLERAIDTHMNKDAAMAQVKRIALYFVAIGLAGFVAGTFPGIRGALNMVFDYIVRKRYFGEVMQKDIRFFSHFRSGDIITRLTSDISDFPKLSWFLCSGIFRAVESASKVTFCIAAMLSLDWRLALASLASLPIMLLVFTRTQSAIYDRVNKNEQAISAINNQLEMSFSGVKVIKAFASEEKYTRFFDDALARRFETEMGVIKLETILQLIYQYIDYVAQVALVFVGGLMVTRRTISIGTFYAFYNYLNMLIYPVLDIPQLFVFGKRAFVNIDRLEEMRRYATERAAAEGAVPEGSLQQTSMLAETEMEGAQNPPSQHASKPASLAAPPPRLQSLRFEKATVYYERKHKPAIAEIGVEVRAGDKILVIGPVGSGKTTLIKTALGLLEPRSGRVLLNGRPVRELGPLERRGLVGYVPQDPLLFSGTIRENILLGLKEGQTLSQLEMERILEVSRLSDELAAFPEGLETRLGQRGTSVSGGQKQRIAIARALAGYPSLLLLDDMTASLDTNNEEALWKSLAEMPEFTRAAVIAVSHRLSSIQYVDRVLFLKNGRIAGFGTHAELMAENAGYREFVAEHVQMPGA
ncbi:MAG: ABC transporter ATP-binding protein [Rectinema subterraneum]|uniref:ABC transporter ATP-binding protein n=1 Tax=Rectinema subterraneum TaxID=2653714 RepID=UPI003C7994B2